MHVSFHHGFTWHGSGINTSDKHRRAIVSHCVPYDTKFHPINDGGTAKTYKKYKQSNSDELDEKYFPLLWKELMSNLYHKDIYDFDNPVKSY